MELNDVVTDLNRLVTTLSSRTSVLEKLGLRYFVTGSVAAIFFGEPRFTIGECQSLSTTDTA